MRFRDETRNRDVEVNLTPLIDVVFLLLIFFMVTTTFRQETKLQIELPESSSEQSLSQTDNTLQVEINADGKFALKG
ncbi:MAG: biopolymer transporter ExbD, partial [Gammaproteobacteria bacterium]